MARPKKYNINIKQLKNLARFGCTNKEMGEFFGCSPDLIGKSYSDIITKGRAEMKLRLRQLQWKSAERGNVTMQIWLGKNVLNQTDTPLDEEDGTILPWSD